MYQIDRCVMSVPNLNMGLSQVFTLPLALLGQWLPLQVLFPGLAGSCS